MAVLFTHVCQKAGEGGSGGGGNGGDGGDGGDCSLGEFPEFKTKANRQPFHSSPAIRS